MESVLQLEYLTSLFKVILRVTSHHKENYTIHWPDTLAELFSIFNLLPWITQHAYICYLYLHIYLLFLSFFFPEALTWLTFSESQSWNKEHAQMMVSLATGTMWILLFPFFFCTLLSGLSTHWFSWRLGGLMHIFFSKNKISTPSRIKKRFYSLLTWMIIFIYYWKKSL